MKKPNIRRGLKITIINLSVALAFAFFADYIGLDKQIVNMIFLLEVLFTTFATGGYGFACLTGVYGFLIINYFFTPPRFGFAITNAGDIMSLITFTITAIIVGVTVSDLRQQRDRAAEGEKAAQELVRLRTEQEETRTKMKQEELRATLLRSVAHDLRSPLTALAGTSRMLEDGYDRFSESERKQFISDMDDEILWLITKVENILNKTRIDENNLLLHKNYEAVDDVVGEAVQRMEHLLRGRKFNVTLPDEVIMVPMDGMLIVQVLTNLMGNAVRHTPDDSEIALTAEKDGGCVRFAVIDTGNGIDPEVRDTLFERFVTLDSQNTDRRRGIGLGLEICKAIVTAHGGEIYARDNEPHGAQFIFTLPLEDKSENLPTEDNEHGA